MLNVEELKCKCRDYLAHNGIAPTSDQGKNLIHAFWMGAISQEGGVPDPHPTICLMTGRYDELVAPPRPATKLKLPTQSEG